MSDVKKPAPAKPAPLRDPRTFIVGAARGAIWIITDDDQLARVQKGERIPKAERKMARYASGERVTGIPAASVPWMLSGGWIVPAPEGAPPVELREGGPMPKRKLYVEGALVKGVTVERKEGSA